MEVENRVLSSRKRTESNGGSSDSDLSDGWNIVDQSDVNGQETPSSDGESIEVIDAESSEHITDEDQESGSKLVEASSQLATLELAAEARETSATVVAFLPPAHEGVFDPSFIWFLLFAAFAVITSNFAFMVAENALGWNVDTNIDSPSFLKDLPTTPQPLQPDHIHNIVPYVDGDEATVDTIDDVENVEDSVAKIMDRTENKEESKLITKEPSLTFDNHGLEKYHKIFNDFKKSGDSQNKFVQALAILDALDIGLKDLEEIASTDSELYRLLTKQKNRLNEVKYQVEFIVNKAFSRVANNVLMKVQNLERRFEKQWCYFEKKGYKEELKGLFYDCYENEENSYKTSGKEPKYFEEPDYQFDLEEKSEQKKQTTTDDYQYEVDKDSTGKVYSKPNSEYKETDDYYKLVKDRMHIHELYTKNRRHEKLHNANNEKPTSEKTAAEAVSKYLKKNCERKNFESDKIDKNSNTYQKFKDEIFEKIKISDKLFDSLYEKYCIPKYSSRKVDHKKKQLPTHNIKKPKEKSTPEKSAVEFVIKYLRENCGKIQTSRKMSNDYLKLKDVIDDKVFIPTEMFDSLFERYCTHNYHINSKIYRENDGIPIKEQSAIEIATKYLRKNCEKNQKHEKMAKNINGYQKLKDGIDEILWIPKTVFDTLYEKYCKQSYSSFNWDKKSKNENLKGDYSDANSKKYFVKRDPEIIEHNEGFKNIINIKEADVKGDESSQSVGDKVIESTGERRRLYSFEEFPSHMKTNTTGYWFIKAGESRSRMRWSHQRSDWWFERASYRRKHPRPPATTQFKKMWNRNFRRAWELVHSYCPQNPHDKWCDSTGDEPVTVAELMAKWM